MVGFRVFDVGLLVVWLVWFFRLREDDTDPPGEGGDGGGGSPKPKTPRSDPGGGGLQLPGGRWPTGKSRPRDGHQPARTPLRRRHAPPLPNPLPARVRSPGSPTRVTRRS
jgi:hypothetical protein